MNFILLLFLIGLVLFIGSSISTDKYIEYLHEFNQDAWKEIGKPRGMLFNPRGSSYFSFVILSFSWVRDLPEEIFNDEVAMKLRARILVWGKFIKWYSIMLIPLTIVSKII